MLIVLLQNVMHMKHFEIYILKLTNILTSQNLIDRLNWIFVAFYFQNLTYCVLKLYNYRN